MGYFTIYSISQSYKKNYIEGSDTQTFYIVSRVFCGWDYNITNKAAASLRHKSFYNDMKVGNDVCRYLLKNTFYARPERSAGGI